MSPVAAPLLGRGIPSTPSPPSMTDQLSSWASWGRGNPHKLHFQLPKHLSPISEDRATSQPLLQSLTLWGWGTLTPQHVVTTSTDHWSPALIHICTAPSQHTHATRDAGPLCHLWLAEAAGLLRGPTLAAGPAPGAVEQTRAPPGSCEWAAVWAGRSRRPREPLALLPARPGHVPARMASPSGSTINDRRGRRHREAAPSSRLQLPRIDLLIARD